MDIDLNAGLNEALRLRAAGREEESAQLVYRLSQQGGRKLFDVCADWCRQGRPLQQALAADILSQAPDVITLQEVSVRNEPLLEMLRRAYPHQHLCRSTSVRGLAVLSRLPAGRSRFCDPTGGMAGLRLESEFGPVWAVSLHLVWPWPLPQAEQVRRLAPQLAALEAPVILGGDFNMVPWSFAVGRLARASGTRRAGRVPPSFRLGPLPMPIDHVFAPGGGSALPRPFTGSDHRGLMARVRL